MSVDEKTKDGVRWIFINRPPVNALNQELILQLTDKFDEANSDKNVRVIVLTGRGKCFSAGADLTERDSINSKVGGLIAHSRLVRGCFDALRDGKKPVVVAINGPALGAGFGLVASCDILVACPETVLGLPEIDVGLMGGGSHARRIIHNYSLWRRMALTGHRIAGDDLLRLGIVEKCVPKNMLLDEAEAIAKEISGKDQWAVETFKSSLNLLETMSLNDGYRYEQKTTLQKIESKMINNL